MKLIFELVVQDVNVTTELLKQKQLVKELTKELSGVDAGAEGFVELAEKIASAKTQVTDLTEQQRLLNRQFKQTQVPKDSLAGLRLEYSKLAEQIGKLSKAERDASIGKSLISNAASIKSEINSIEEGLGSFTGSVGNYRKAMLSIFDIVSGGLITGGIFSALSALQSFGERAITVNSKVSDSIADVARAASGSVEQIQILSDRLEGRSTRTTLLDQLDIAKIGAKLGVAEQDLFSFVEAIDKVSVTLGDEFGGSVEQTTDVLGKLRNVLTGFKTDDIAQDITHLGNALTFLEAQGVAGAASIADFAGRIGGVGTGLGASAGQILGVSTTLAELGIDAERGASGFIRIMQQVAAAPAQFAKAAGVGKDKFTELVNTDIVGAIELFLEKLNSRNLSNTEFQKVLDKLKLNGVGTSEVVSKLGENLKLLSNRVSESTGKLQESSTITDAFGKKNSTLAAEVQKVINQFDNFLTNSAFSDGLASGIRGFGQLTNGVIGVLTAFTQLPKFIDENKAALLGLVAGIELLNGGLIFASLNTLRLAVVQKGQAVITGIITVAQNLLNVAMRANPIGAVITVVSLLVIGFQQLFDRSEKFRAVLSAIGSSTTQLFAILSEAFTKLLDGDFAGASEAFSGFGKKMGDAFASGYNGALEKIPDARDLFESERDDRQRSTRITRTISTETKTDTDDAKALKATNDAKKRFEDQIKRISELRKSVRDLDAQTITNDFDKKEIEIENQKIEELKKIANERENIAKRIAEQKGIVTSADKQELDLISEQTASVTALYDMQQKKITESRQKAIEKQLQDLVILSAEIRTLAEQNAIGLAQAESEILNTGFQAANRELENLLNERKKNLTEQLESGTISQKDFKNEFIKSQEEFNTGSLQLERDRATAQIQINENLEKSRIDAAKGAFDIRLAQIQSETEAEIQAAIEQAAIQGGDAGNNVDALKLRATQQRIAAEQDYNNAVRDATDERVKSEIDAADAIINADNKKHENRLAQIQSEAEKRRELNQAIMQSASEIAGAVFAINRNRIEKEEQEGITALDNEFTARRESAAGNADELAKLDIQYQKKKEALEKEAAQKRKKMAITEAIINGALAVVKALPNLILAAVAAVATAAQVAVISSQTFAAGGIPRFQKTGVFGGRSHSSGGTKGRFDDGTNIEVERDEVFVILNKRASRQLRQLSDFNFAHGGNRFADGGSLSFTPQFQTSNDNTQQIAVMALAAFTDEQIDVFAKAVANETSIKTRNAVVAGLDDRNRTAERQTVLESNSEI